MAELHGYHIVATDFFRRHYLVYDAAYIKIGSLDCHRGVWTFTLANSDDTWFGYTRDDAFRHFICNSGSPAGPLTKLAFMG